jgi:hypothetical protein
MFGGRLVPSALIGIGLAAIMFVVGGVAEKLGILAVVTLGVVGPLFGLVGFAIPVGIGLYQDYNDSKAADGQAARKIV